MTLPFQLMGSGHHIHDVKRFDAAHSRCNPG